MANKELKDVKLFVDFSQAENRENIVSMENISTSFGKIAKVIADLEAGKFSNSAKINDVEVTGELDSVSDLKIPGKSVAGTEYTVDGTQYTAESGAEIYNSYTDNYGIGSNSSTFGWGNKNFSDNGIVGGSQNNVYNFGSFVFGSSNNVGSSSSSGNYGYVLGSGNTISSTGSHNTAIGEQNTISGSSTRCVAMGHGNTINDTYATSTNTQSYGLGNTVSGELNFVRGFINNVKGKYTSVDGWNNTIAGGYCDRIEGYKNNISSSGQYSHIEGNTHTISGQYQNTHVEGNNNSIKNTVNGIHVEGAYNTINGECDQISVSGTNNTLSGMCNSGSTISGSYNTINGCWSTYVGGANNNVSLLGQGFVHGYNLLVNGSHNSTTLGKNNVEDTAGDYCFVIGNGESASARSNALAVTWGGEIVSATGKVLSSNDYTLEDKTKLSSIENGANKTVIDDALDRTSTNPVENRAVTNKFAVLSSTIGVAETRNLLPNNCTTRTINGVTVTKNSDGTLTLDGSCSEKTILCYNMSTGATTESGQYSTKAVLAPGTYRGWLGHAHALLSLEICLSSTTNTIERTIRVMHGIKFTIPVGYKYVWVRLTCYGAASFDNFYVWPMISHSDDDLDLTGYIPYSPSVYCMLEDKVDAVYGKGLSTNDYTDLEKAKLASITNPMVIKGTVSSALDLPTTAEIGWIYFVGADGSSEYDEYVYTENSTWEVIGHTTIDMSGYVQTTDIATTTNVGLVKPDGVTLTANTDGVLSAVTGTEDEIDAMFSDTDWEY